MTDDSTKPDQGKPPQPSPREGLRAVWRLSGHELWAFVGAMVALVGSAALLYAAPLVPKSVFDLVLDPAAEPSAISRSLVGWMGGTERVRDALWIPALAMIALAALSGVAIHLKARLAAGALGGCALPARSTARCWRWRRPTRTPTSGSCAISGRRAMRAGGRGPRPRSR